MKKLKIPLTSSFENGQSERPFSIHTLDYIKEEDVCEHDQALNESLFSVIFITGGHGDFLTGLEKTAIANNDLLIVSPRDFNKLRLIGELDGYLLSFMPSFFDSSDYGAESLYDNTYQMFAETRLVNIDGDSLTDMQDIMEIMLKEFTRHNLYRGQVLKRYFKIFLIHLAEQFKTLAEITRQPRNNEILYNFMSQLEKYFRVKKMVADYADMLSVTPNYLNEVIKKLTGVSAGCHIRKRIALEAKRQAINSNTCMKSIAYDLGFLDLAHFSKFFKNTTGINFSDFKKTGVLPQPVN